MYPYSNGLKETEIEKEKKGRLVWTIYTVKLANKLPFWEVLDSPQHQRRPNNINKSMSIMGTKAIGKIV